MPKQEEPTNNPSLESLDKAIQAAKKRQLSDSSESGRSGAGDAMRIGVELMAGILVGAFAGYWLDQWLGTLPIFFLLCFFLGVAGSGLNIYRMSKRVATEDTDGHHEG